MSQLQRTLLTALLVSLPCFPATVFTDSNFNLANYNQTAVFSINGTMVTSQCASCGNPGNALQAAATLGDSSSQVTEAAQGYVNSTFSYNPLVQGIIASITASVDKNLSIDQTATNPPFTNTFRPLIQQGGNYYLAAILGPAFTGGSTGFLTLSQSGLQATDFVQFDFTTGNFITGSNPNFAGGSMLFGLGQISGVGSFSGTTRITAVYDNLNIAVNAVPEPSSFLLLAGAVPLFAAIRRRLRL